MKVIQPDTNILYRYKYRYKYTNIQIQIYVEKVKERIYLLFMKI